MWEQLNDVGTDGVKREGAVGFSCNGKGYVGFGNTLNGSVKGQLNDFWEFDSTGNGGKGKWTKVIPTSGPSPLGREYGIGFGIGDYAYIGMGNRGNDNLKDFWRYHTKLKTWERMPDPPHSFSPRMKAVAFSIQGKGYIGTGCILDSLGNTTMLNDFWEFNPRLYDQFDLDNTDILWRRLDNYPEKHGIMEAASFSMKHLGFVGSGYSHQTNDGNIDSATSSFYSLDPNANPMWKKLQPLPTRICRAVGMSRFDSKGYFGTNFGAGKTFYEFDGTNWKDLKSDLAVGREFAVGFSLNDRIYVGTGFNDSVRDRLLKDFYAMTN